MIYLYLYHQFINCTSLLGLFASGCFWVYSMYFRLIIYFQIILHQLICITGTFLFNTCYFWCFLLVSSRLKGRRQWHPTPLLLPGKSHGQRSLVGCSPWDREESDMTEWLHFHFLLSCIGEGNGSPIQCSCLENPGDGRAWWAAVFGVVQSQTWLKRLSSSSSSSSSSKTGGRPFEVSGSTFFSGIHTHTHTHTHIYFFFLLPDQFLLIFILAQIYFC